MMCRSDPCRGCGTQRNRAEFYESNQARYKACVRNTAGAYRAENIVRIRAYDRRRALRPDRIKKTIAVTAAWRARGPAARAAHSLVAHAVQSGKLKRGKCEACGSLRVHAHHDDYLSPLDVRWLCAEHHKQWHGANGPGANAASHVPDRRKKAA